MKIALIIACIGHIICGITDCMLAYMKNGRFEFSDVKDNKKMQKVFEGASLKQIELAMLIGVFALFMIAFGYIGVSKLICENSPAVGCIMLGASVFFIEVLKPCGTFMIVNESDGTDETSLKFEKIIDGMKCHTVEEIEDALKSAGFSKVKSDHHNSKPWITVIARK